MADLVIGGAVGAGMGEVLKLALETVKKGIDFKPTLKRNIETLNALAPLLEQMKHYNKELGLPIEEVERLETELRAGEKLAKKCSKPSLWRFLFLAHFHDKLQAEDESLKRYLSFDVQAQNARNLMETLSKVRQILEILNKVNFELSHGKQIGGLSGAPAEPEYVVGMDEPLNKLKIELLKDGVSILVLTGLAGSGKSTLAKKLCWDPQIKGKFGGNIFFVTVSKTPNLKTIVQTLFEHRYSRCPVPEFQSDEDAINQLGLLLGQISRNPILLVLDDVYSEALFKKFKFRMPDYKILVTSRVALRSFDSTLCHLEPLDHDNAESLFRHFAQPNVSSYDKSMTTSSYIPENDLVQKIVRGCKGSPLALEVIGGSLCQQPFEIWQNMKESLQSQSILESNSDLLSRLQNSLDILEDNGSTKKKCFMDLGLFPEDQRIHVPALIDMWAELRDLDEDGWGAMAIIHALTTRNLINVKVTRKVARDEDMYYNNHFVILHDLLRELAIYQSSREPFEKRERLIIDLSGDNRPKWWVGQNQQGIFGYIWSFFPRRLIEPKQLRVAARILSISTDENFTSDWCDMQPDEAEVLVLNIHSSRYSLPEFTEKMSKLKVLIVTNYGFHCSKLNKFELLGSLSDLIRIRLEKVSVPRLCILKNLRKLSLHMCDIRQAFETCSTQISDAVPNLVELSVDYCNDLVNLPDALCNITPLKKISITNCHKLSALPRDIAKLKNLEVLRLCSCSDLQKMPDSVGGLQNLRCLDISDCVSLSKLPDDIGELHNLEKFYMKGCSRLSELPSSVMDFEHLKHDLYVICDEERDALWKNFPRFSKLKIEMSNADINLDWLHGVRS